MPHPELSLRHLPDASSDSFSFQIPSTSTSTSFSFQIPTDGADNFLLANGSDFFRLGGEGEEDDLLASPQPRAGAGGDQNPLTLSQLTPLHPRAVPSPAVSDAGAASLLPSTKANIVVAPDARTPEKAVVKRTRLPSKPRIPSKAVAGDRVPAATDSYKTNPASNAMSGPATDASAAGATDIASPDELPTVPLPVPPAPAPAAHASNKKSPLKKTVTSGGIVKPKKNSYLSKDAVATAKSTDTATTVKSKDIATAKSTAPTSRINARVGDTAPGASSGGITDRLMLYGAQLVMLDSFPPPTDSATRAQEHADDVAMEPIVHAIPVPEDEDPRMHPHDEDDLPMRADENPRVHDAHHGDPAIPEDVPMHDSDGPVAPRDPAGSPPRAVGPLTLSQLSPRKVSGPRAEKEEDARHDEEVIQEDARRAGLGSVSPMRPAAKRLSSARVGADVGEGSDAPPPGKKSRVGRDGGISAARGAVRRAGAGTGRGMSGGARGVSGSARGVAGAGRSVSDTRVRSKNNSARNAVRNGTHAAGSSSAPDVGRRAVAVGAVAVAAGAGATMKLFSTEGVASAQARKLASSSTQTRKLASSTSTQARKVNDVNATVPLGFNFHSDGHEEARKLASSAMHANAKHVGAGRTREASNNNSDSDSQSLGLASASTTLGASAASIHPGKKAYAIPDFKALHAAHDAQAALRRTQRHAAATVPVAPNFSTDARIKERGAFDARVREKEEREKEEREVARREREAEEERELREMRRRAVPRAHEVPEWYREAPKKKKRDLGGDDV